MTMSSPTRPKAGLKIHSGQGTPGRSCGEADSGNKPFHAGRGVRKAFHVRGKRLPCGRSAVAGLLMGVWPPTNHGGQLARGARLGSQCEWETRTRSRGKTAGEADGI